jgi:NADPH2:quinone reductase
LLPLLSGEGRAHHGEILREVARLVEAGKISPRVDPRRFGLGEVHAAYELVRSRDAAGKVVVEIG